MHIELTEMLRCPAAHPPEHLVLSTGQMLGRSVRSGTVGCPVCRREYRITDGVVDFRGAGSGERVAAPAGSGAAPGAAASRSPSPADVIQAALDLSGPGGLVALVGSAARHAAGLAALMDGVHFVATNAPPDVAETAVLSLLAADGEIPLRDAVVRGAVVGAEAAGDAWLAEAVRVVLPGRRLVVEGGRHQPPGAVRLAADERLWVGEKA
jgi:uncharacterized protein YbaR (Trm112 family)